MIFSINGEYHERRLGLLWAADKLVDESSRHMMTKEGEGGPGANMSGG